MAQKEVDKYTAKLQLLAKGQLTEAAAVAVGGGKAADTAKGISEADDAEVADGSELKGSGPKGIKGFSSPPLDGMAVRSVCCLHHWFAHRQCTLWRLTASCTNNQPGWTRPGCHAHT